MDRVGGFYADMDTTALRSLESLRSHPTDPSLILGLDTVRKPNRQTRQEYLQWFLASSPGHPVWKLVVDIIERRYQLVPPESFMSGGQQITDSYTLWLTGPRAFTSAVTQYLASYGNQGILELDASLLGNYQSFRTKQRPYLIHHYQGSWKQHWNHQKWKLPRRNQKKNKPPSEAITNLSAAVVIQALRDLFSTDRYSH